MTRSILSYVGAALAALALVAACGDDEKKTATGPLSGKGESCTRTADCGSGLVCAANVCVATARTLPDGGGIAGDGGLPGVALGGEGESCTRRADCKSGLACVLQTCTAGNPTSNGGDGGGGKSILGSRGESCLSVRDCGDG